MSKSLPTLLVSVLLALPTSATAQAYAVDRGSVVLGGTVSWSSSGGDLYENVDGDRYTSLLLSPRVLYFVAPGLGIGGDLYVESASQGDEDVTTIAVGPAIAYFFGSPESTAYPFVGGFVGYGTTSTSGIDGSGLAFGATVGVAFMLSDAVAVTAGGSYGVVNMNIDQLDESFGGNTIGLELGVEAFLF